MILIVPGSTDVTRMAPEFKLTPGAVIEPASGTVRDFTTPKLYKVTSQDGRWNKSYLVSVIETDLPTLFSFEDWKEIGQIPAPDAMANMIPIITTTTSERTLALWNGIF